MYVLGICAKTVTKKTASENKYYKSNLLPMKFKSEKFKKTLLIIGLLGSIVSIILILISYYISGDKTQLYKLSLPAMILMLSILQIRQTKKAV